jgi:WD40 repeat protein
VLIQGHYSPLRQDNNEAWGLSIFANKEQYVTVSDDSTLRIWDTTTHKQLKWVNLNLNEKGLAIPVNPTTKEASHAAQGRAVDVNPKGDKIAVGMRDGTLRIYSYTPKEIKLTYLKKISKEWIEDLKFSPDGTKLAVGSHDNFIYVFDVQGAAMTMKKMGASSSYITHLDWSLDSQSLRTNDGSYELLYYDVTAGKQLTSGASQFKDEPWATNSCALTWATQGVWQPGQDGSDINHCDRSHGPVVDGLQLVATADDSSKLNLYRYPSPQEAADPLKLTAHSSHVTKCRWAPQDNFIFTLGGNDTTTMQWRVTKQ